MCCLGFVACALGYTPDQIRDELTPAGAYDVHEILWPGQGDRPVALPAYDDAMSMNDLSTYAAGGEERREARLTEILAAVDIELSFVDGPL